MSDLVYRIEKFFGGVFIFDYIFIGSGVQNIQSNLDIILLRNYNDRDPGFLISGAGFYLIGIPGFIAMRWLLFDRDPGF